MSKKRRMRNYKLLKKKEQRFGSMPADFVDANVLLDAIIDENSDSLKYLLSFRTDKKMLVTSTHAIGETIKVIYHTKEYDKEFDVDKSREALHRLIVDCGIKIDNFDDETLLLIRQIMDEDTRLTFNDAIHVALACQWGCSRFCSRDTSIGHETLKKFDIKKIDPSKL